MLALKDKEEAKRVPLPPRVMYPVHRADDLSGYSQR